MAKGDPCKSCGKTLTRPGHYCAACVTREQRQKNPQLVKASRDRFYAKNKNVVLDRQASYQASYRTKNPGVYLERGRRRDARIRRNRRIEEAVAAGWTSEEAELMVGPLESFMTVHGRKKP